MLRTSVSPAPAQINTAAQRPEREREGEHRGGRRKKKEGVTLTIAATYTAFTRYKHQRDTDA